MKAPSKSVQIAKNFLTTASAEGYTVTVEGGRVKVTKTFTKNDRNAFLETDIGAAKVLSLLGGRGSQWGTDGIAGMVATQNGVLTLTQAGVPVLVYKALTKLV